MLKKNRMLKRNWREEEQDAEEKQDAEEEQDAVFITNTPFSWSLSRQQAPLSMQNHIH